MLLAVLRGLRGPAAGTGRAHSERPSSRLAERKLCESFATPRCLLLLASRAACEPLAAAARRARRGARSTVVVQASLAEQAARRRARSTGAGKSLLAPLLRLQARMSVSSPACTVIATRFARCRSQAVAAARGVCISPACSPARTPSDMHARPVLGLGAAVVRGSQASWPARSPLSLILHALALAAQLDHVLLVDPLLPWQARGSRAGRSMPLRVSGGAGAR